MSSESAVLDLMSGLSVSVVAIINWSTISVVNVNMEWKMNWLCGLFRRMFTHHDEIDLTGVSSSDSESDDMMSDVCLDCFS